MTLRDLPPVRALAEERARDAFNAEKVHTDRFGNGDHWAYRNGFDGRAPQSKAWAIKAQLDLLCNMSPGSRDALVRLVERFGDASDVDKARHHRDNPGELEAIALAVLA